MWIASSPSRATYVSTSTRAGAVRASVSKMPRPPCGRRSFAMTSSLTATGITVTSVSSEMWRRWLVGLRRSSTLAHAFGRMFPLPASSAASSAFGASSSTQIPRDSSCWWVTWTGLSRETWMVLEIRRLRFSRVIPCSRSGFPTSSNPSNDALPESWIFASGADTGMSSRRCSPPGPRAAPPARGA